MDGKARRDAFGRRELLVLSALGLVAGAQRPAFAGSPQGQLTWAVHISLAPTWFDPAIKYPPFKGKLKLFKKIIR